MIGSAQFGVGEIVCGGEHRLTLTGELDLASTPILQGAIASLSAAMNGTRAITLDLSGLQFIDSTGLRAILATREFCQANGYEFSLVPGPPHVQCLFEIVKLVDALPWRSPSAPSSKCLTTDGVAQLVLAHLRASANIETACPRKALGLRHAPAPHRGSPLSPPPLPARSRSLR